MTVVNFIRKFPEISKKNAEYYLYLGMVTGLTAKETLTIIIACLDQDILKRKILLNKVIYSASTWSVEENDSLFDKVYKSRELLSSYFKKESASMILMALFPHVSKDNQNKLTEDSSQSKYKNNRKRIYRYFYKNWSPNFQTIIEKAWVKFKDEDAIGLIVAKMPREFLLKNLDELLTYFYEEELKYNFFLKLLRNKLYTRIYDDIPTKIQKLKKNDPISYIFIKKDRKEKLDIPWAIEVYKKFSESRFLARWYSEMGLWKEILKVKPEFLSEIKS